MSSRNSSSSQVPRLPLINSHNAGAMVTVPDGPLPMATTSSARGSARGSNNGAMVTTTPRTLVSSSRTRYTMSPRNNLGDSGNDGSDSARLMTTRDLQSLSAYIDANKKLGHKHRVGRAANLIPAAPFSKVRENCDVSLGLSLAIVNAKESALDYPLRLSPPEEYHAPKMTDPHAKMSLSTRIVKVLKGSSSVPQHWEGEKAGTERDVAHITALRDVEMRVVAARRAQNVFKEAISTFTLAAMHYNASNLEKATAKFQSCANLFEQLQDAQGVALCHNLLGVCHYRLGDAKLALVHHKKVEAIAGPYCKSVAQLNMGVCYVALDETDFAVQAFTDANSNALAANDSVLEALAVGNLGMAFMRQGDMRQAQTNIEQCLEHCSIAGDKVGAAVCLLLLGEIYSSVKDHSHSQFYYEHAFRVAEEAKCTDVAEIARVGVGIARGNQAIKAKVVESSHKMGQQPNLNDMLLMMPDRK